MKLTFEQPQSVKLLLHKKTVKSLNTRLNLHKQDPDAIPAQRSLCKTVEKAIVNLKGCELRPADLTQHSEPDQPGSSPGYGRLLLLHIHSHVRNLKNSLLRAYLNLPEERPDKSVSLGNKSL